MRAQYVYEASNFHRVKTVRDIIGEFYPGQLVITKEGRMERRVVYVVDGLNPDGQNRLRLIPIGFIGSTIYDDDEVAEPKFLFKYPNQTDFLVSHTFADWHRPLNNKERDLLNKSREEKGNTQYIPKLLEKIKYFSKSDITPKL